MEMSGQLPIAYEERASTGQQAIIARRRRGKKFQMAISIRNYCTVIKSVPVVVPAVAVIVAVPALGKVAVPLEEDAKLTNEELSDFHVTAPLAPLAVKVALLPTLKTTSG